MTRTIPTGSILFFSLALALASACTNERDVLSPAGEKDMARASMARNDALSTVNRVEERDLTNDGIVDLRYTSTAWYDAQGNKVKEVFDGDDPAGGVIESHSVTVYTYQRGVVVGWTQDHDYMSDGTLDNIYTSTAVEFDAHGYPSKMVSTWDQGADGTIDSQSESFPEFDQQGKLLHSGDFTYEYDAHGNVIQLYNSGHLFKTSEYSPHDALVYQVIHWLSEGEEVAVQELSTLAYDGQGNPTRQVFEGRNSLGTIERSTFTITYDTHRNPLTIREERDGLGDGTIDAVFTTVMEYGGPGRHLGHLEPAGSRQQSAAVSAQEIDPNSREQGVSRAIR
jgi:hypothetical protein